MEGEGHTHASETHHDAPHSRHEHGAPESHPEHTHPLGVPHEQHSPREKRVIAFLSLCLVATVVFVPLLAGMSYSPIPNVLLGLSPLLAMLVIDLLLARAHFKRALFWGSLLATHFLGLVWVNGGNFLLENPVNVPQAIAVSVLFGIPITIIAWLIDGGAHVATPPRRTLPQEFTPDALPQFVSAIEDKAKALNFAIGRVYRNSNGGSAKLRERLRIPREWYNEFTQADEKDRKTHARVLVQKIHDRLLQYRKTEKELFSEQEFARFKNLSRHTAGESTVLDVLIANDTDPVEQYYRSAIETCEQILEGLQQ